MQHIYSHAQNLGNECADHAAALGAFGPVSNENFSARWARPSFDCISCFATCDSLGDVLENYVMLKLRAYLPPNAGSGVSVSVPHRVSS